MVRDSGVLKVAQVVGVFAALLGGVLAYFFVSQSTQDNARKNSYDGEEICASNPSCVRSHEDVRWVERPLLHCWRRLFLVGKLPDGNTLV